MISPLIITLYALIPMGIALIGGMIASVYILNHKMIAALQHLIAGIVIGAVAIELLPKIIGHASPWTIGIGFVLGVAVMFGVHELSHFLAKKEGSEGIPIGMIVGSAIDLFIDGLLIGVAFIAGLESGVLIAISLSLCAFFLNLMVSSTMTQKKIGLMSQYTAIFIIALMLPIGALVGSSIVVQLPSQILVETLAFGVAALLYLGTEELLAEAHEVHDTAWVSLPFFVGFLIILLLK